MAYGHNRGAASTQFAGGSVVLMATMQRSKIDVSRYVQELEQVLLSWQDPVKCENALAILERWQFDEMLDDASRAKAKTLVQEFESRSAQTPMKIRHVLRRYTGTS